MLEPFAEKIKNIFIHFPNLLLNTDKIPNQNPPGPLTKNAKKKKKKNPSDTISLGHRDLSQHFIFHNFLQYIWLHYHKIWKQGVS